MCLKRLPHMVKVTQNRTWAQVRIQGGRRGRSPPPAIRKRRPYPAAERAPRAEERRHSKGSAEIGRLQQKLGSPSRRVTPNCLFPADESRPSSRWAPPAEEGVSLQEYKIPSVQEGRPWQRKGTLSRRRVPLKRSDAPAKGERRPHSEKRGALTAAGRPSKKGAP